jgi:hypothetical protein
MHRKIHSPTLSVGPTTLDALLDTSVGPSTLMAVADLMTPKRKRSTKKPSSPKRKTAKTAKTSKRKTTKTSKRKTAKTASKGRKPCKAGKIRDRVTKRCRAPKK